MLFRSTGATGLEFVEDTLTSLVDTPADYTGGVAGYRLVVNSTPDGIEFIEDSFLNLSDTPADYTGHGLKLVRVNTGETALEFVAQAVVGTGTDGQTLVWDTDQWVANSNIFNDTTNNEVGINTAAPHSTLHVNGSFAVDLVPVTADYDMTVGTNDDVRTILVNNAAGATIDLPSAVGIEGREYHIKKISNTGGGRTVTIDPNGVETIDDNLTFTLNAKYEAITVVSDGANWWIV